MLRMEGQRKNVKIKIFILIFVTEVPVLFSSFPQKFLVKAIFQMLRPRNLCSSYVTIFFRPPCRGGGALCPRPPLYTCTLVSVAFKNAEPVPMNTS